MSRRALRKIDPALDLTRRLKTFDELPDPWDDLSLFDCPAPLEVEIGSGKGLFLASAAADVPDHNFLGIEIARKYARFSAARLAKQDLTNACIVAGDGQRVLTELLRDESVCAVHVYFPDPWWKKRHRRRRIMNELFLREVQRTLLPGGTLHFWTDVQEYFEVSLELIRQTTALVGPLEEPERPAEHDLDYRTHFERRMRLSGEPVYRSAFCKQP